MISFLSSLPFVVKILVAALTDYLLGSSNMAYYLGKIKGVNLREGGSGNLGTSNALVMLGFGAAALTFIHDTAKSVLAIWLVRTLFPDTAYIEYVAGVGSVLGHIFPFYLKFYGGKGFAAFLGMVLAIDWKFFLVLVVLIAVATLVTDYIVAGTFTTIVAYPFFLACTGRFIPAAIVLLATLVIFWAHRVNIARLKKGEEIRFRSAFKKKET